ncbi:hypothetical protein BJX99DRAFT_267403 [Aspergillus californicus]
MKTIAIIGGGWSGCHVALELADAGHHVTIIEKGDDIFHGVSGQFGIRIHKGPHYPRSSGTRDSCRRTFVRFCSKYPELVVNVKPAIYSLGRTDSNGCKSKVTADVFGKVCSESEECSAVNVHEHWGGSELEVAYNLDEPCAVLNPYLKTYFRERLSKAGIEVRLGEEVYSVYHQNDQHFVSTSSVTDTSFDKVINATGADIRYQACIALKYRDTSPDNAPQSFIVMDGWFPCLMPCVGDPEVKGEYILTHGAYTILGSWDTPTEANSCLSQLTPEILEAHIRPKIEREMERFWPGFTKRFTYEGWKGSVLPKMVTDTEFRSSVVFEKDSVIYIFPGKISNVVEAADEVFSLIDGRNVVSSAGYGIARDSELNRSKKEIEEKPSCKERNTCFLQTHKDLTVVV